MKWQVQEYKATRGIKVSFADFLVSGHPTVPDDFEIERPSDMPREIDFSR